MFPWQPSKVSNGTRKYTIDWDIFAVKIIRVKNFRVIKFSRFRLIHNIFLTVNGCNMDERLESSVRAWRVTIRMSTWRVTIRHQESKESLAVVVDRTFILGSVDLHAQASSLFIAV